MSRSCCEFHRTGVEVRAVLREMSTYLRLEGRECLSLPGLIADIDTMKRELMDAFRIYDKEGRGFITMDTLRALIAEQLSPLTDKELDGIIAELDENGSGTMDFDEFCEMTGELKYVHSSGEILLTDELQYFPVLSI